MSSINSNGFNPLSAGEYGSLYYTRPFMAGGTDAFLRPLPGLLNVPSKLAPSVLPSTQPIQQTTPSTTPSITDITSKIPTGLDFSKPFFTPGSTIAKGIDDIGAAIGLTGKVAQGPMTTGGAGYASGLSTAFTPAAALGGFAGSVASDILGLSGKYSGITGAVGGAAGTAIGASVGSVGGPLGAIAGSFIGSALGGLFGGGPKPNPASVVGSDFGVTKSGTFADGGKLSSKHVDDKFASTMRNTLNNFNTSIHQQTGIDLSKTINTLYSGYDTNHGPAFISFNSYYKKGHEHNVPETTFYFDPNNPQGLETALRNYGTKLLEKTGQEYDPEQVSQIINNALSSTNQPDTQGIIDTDTQITQKMPGGASFDEFLTEYNKRYQENAIT